MIGISTCWWAGTSLTPEQVVAEILRMGLEGVELEYRIGGTEFQAMKGRLREHLQVLSVHNFFPRPNGLDRGGGDLFLLSSRDEGERTRAVSLTIRSMQKAEEMGARAVVLHLGRVKMDDPTGRLRTLHAAGRLNTPEGKSFLRERKRCRGLRSGAHLDRVLSSLGELNRAAERMDLMLGVENRYHFNEIPDFRELGRIFREFQGGRVGYWHDVGHAGVQENLHICRQMDLLQAYGDELLGIHLHDVKGTQDHLAPGQGEIDFSGIAACLGEGVIKILEVHPNVGKSDLLAGIRLVRERLR